MRHTDCTLIISAVFPDRLQISPCSSRDGRLRRRWLCWKLSWTVALETGQCFIKRHWLDTRYREEIMFKEHQLTGSSNMCFVLLRCRQDVAYQMRTKTKDECESHYMKNFINNPLFSSTLLSMRKTKDSRFAEGAIPFKRQYPHIVHPCLYSFWPIEGWRLCSSSTFFLVLLSESITNV